MENSSSNDILKSKLPDYSAAIGRAGANLIPFVGPVLAEIIGVTIPNQRTDRIVKFAEDLNNRLINLEEGLLELHSHDEEFTDLVEEAIRQAAHSLSDERRGYIASMVVNGLTAESINFAESRHLLCLLEEINDIEVVWLRYYREPLMNGDTDFREKNKDVLTHLIAYIGSSKDIVNKRALQESYKEHLSQIGLLEHRYKTDRQTKLPEFNSISGAMEISGYRLTTLGSLLLDEIGLGNQEGTQ